MICRGRTVFVLQIYFSLNLTCTESSEYKTNPKETKYDPVKDKSSIVRISSYTDSKHVNLICLYLLTGKTNERFTLCIDDTVLNA